MKNIIFGLSLLTLLGCSDDARTRETLMKSGYSNVTTSGHKFFTCGKDDTYCTGFTATNPQGMIVDGAVGCGMFFKGCTVRF